MSESQELTAEFVVRHNSFPAEATYSAIKILACGLKVTPKEAGFFISQRVRGRMARG